LENDQDLELGKVPAVQGKWDVPLSLEIPLQISRLLRFPGLPYRWTYLGPENPVGAILAPMCVFDMSSLKIS